MTFHQKVKFKTYKLETTPISPIGTINPKQTDIKPPVQSFSGNQKLQSPKSSHSSQQGNKEPVLTIDEEFIYTSFEKLINLYNSTYPDDNKQKDFYKKVSALWAKLKNHELKINLLKLVIDFINGNYSFLYNNFLFLSL